MHTRLTKQSPVKGFYVPEGYSGNSGVHHRGFQNNIPNRGTSGPTLLDLESHMSDVAEGIEQQMPVDSLIHPYNPDSGVEDILNFQQALSTVSSKIEDSYDEKRSLQSPPDLSLWDIAEAMRSEERVLQSELSEKSFDLSIQREIGNTEQSLKRKLGMASLPFTILGIGGALLGSLVPGLNMIVGPSAVSALLGGAVTLPTLLSEGSAESEITGRLEGEQQTIAQKLEDLKEMRAGLLSWDKVIRAQDAT